MQNKTSLKFLYFLTVTLLWGHAFAQKDTAQTPLKLADMELNSRLQQEIEKDYFHIKSTVKNIEEKNQSLDYLIIGLHPNSCDSALPRLSLYEKYQDYLGFIKSSRYFEEQQLIDLHLGHALLPFEMGLRFKLPRLKKAGVTRFQFAEGFLKDLRGEIHVSEHKGRCLFISQAKWSGPHTGIAPKIFSFFSTTLSRMAMEGLFRASTQH